MTERTPMDRNTKKVVVRVVKHEVNGQDGYRHQYWFYFSDSEYRGYRIYSAVGPHGFIIKTHGLTRPGEDEERLAAKMARGWHPDLDLIETGSE